MFGLYFAIYINYYLKVSIIKDEKRVDDCFRVNIIRK